jgi:hypothetical protein
VKQVSYSETETVYAAGDSFEEARRRGEKQGFKDSAQQAWNDLDYWERSENPDLYEVFQFVTTTQVTKVDPPYTPRS